MTEGKSAPIRGKVPKPAVKKLRDSAKTGASRKVSSRSNGSSASVDNPRATGKDSVSTRDRILRVATQEFSAKGFDGARIDDIMRLSKVSKNLIYHYFDSKEKLFIAVLEEAYKGMHQNQEKWPLDSKTPVEGIRMLIRSTFAYWRESPEFIGLLNSENFHKGRHLRKSKISKAGYVNLLGNIAKLLKAGVQTGDFRRGVDPIELYISISALAYHYLSNRYTLAYLLDRDLSTDEGMKARVLHIEEIVLGFLQHGAPGSEGSGPRQTGR
ncbi:TetR/AcrR family transcriptional regulator [Nitrobacteraceae bacterium AZCC 2146]